MGVNQIRSIYARCANMSSPNLLKRLFRRRRKRQPQQDQYQSLFFRRLPIEVRNEIYVELWRLSGLEQHIFWHEDRKHPRRSHFCRWPCVTPFDVEDERQKELEILFPDALSHPPPMLLSTEWNWRLKSSWYNHWRCEEEMCEHLKNDEARPRRANFPCHAYNSLLYSPYLPMLLTCKKMYSECIKSIYENTTFVFTNVQTIHAFLGRYACKLGPDSPPTPFLEYTRELQISLPIGFTLLMPYIFKQGIEQPVYSFHWLGLNEMANLRKVSIWIDASMNIFEPADDQEFLPITKLSSETLRKEFASLNTDGHLEVLISSPLSEAVGPDSGPVDEIAPLGVHLWKRNSGDKFFAYPTHDSMIVNFGRGVVWSKSRSRDIHPARAYPRRGLRIRR
ncbi:hypothetical protein F5Y06DRAFT_260915 [Hypoxylon sp. FL0890]|nr:hypothetical protein F5Y06DRAFT_260915 [Hypoxylon sp. FL0890]